MDRGLSQAKEERRSRHWISALKLGKTLKWTHSKICSDHFTEDCYEGLLEYKLGFKTQPRLKSYAIPSLFCFAPEEPDKHGRKARIERRECDKVCEFRKTYSFTLLQSD